MDFRSCSSIMRAGPALLALLLGGCLGLPDDSDDLGFRSASEVGGSSDGLGGAGGDVQAPDFGGGGGDEVGDDRPEWEVYPTWLPQVPVPSIDECIIVVSDPGGAASGPDECAFNPPDAPSTDMVWATSHPIALRMCESLGYQQYCDDVCDCGGEAIVSLSPVLDANNVPQMCILYNPHTIALPGVSYGHPCGCRCTN